MWTKGRKQRLKKLCVKARNVMGVKEDDEITADIMEGLNEWDTTKMREINRELTHLMTQGAKSNDEKVEHEEDTD